VNATHRDLIISSASYSREFGVPRSTGCHLSQVIQRIVEREGKKSYDDWEEEELEGLRTPGFVWERVMGEHARDVNPGSALAYPGEMFWCRDCDRTILGEDVAQKHCSAFKHRGIYFTPDAIITPQWWPLEWKFTWMSSKRASDDATEATGIAHLNGLQKWVWQLGWACGCLEADRAQIQAMFARADYSSSKPKVIAKVFNIEFSPKDLRRIKVMITSNAVAEGLL
jgi:hypothetical protein